MDENCNESLRGKKVRSVNYTNEEKCVLLNMIEKYKEVIECKKTNKITWRDKEIAWRNITKEFNILAPNSTYRSTDSLKKFYENKKKEVRKMAAQERMELRKTGGGVAQNIHDPTYEATLSLMNTKTVKGIYNEFDNDKNDVLSIPNSPHISTNCNIHNYDAENNSSYDVEVLDNLTEEEMYSVEAALDNGANMKKGNENVVQYSSQDSYPGCRDDEIQDSIISSKLNDREAQLIYNSKDQRQYKEASVVNIQRRTKRKKSYAEVEKANSKMQLTENWGNYCPTLLKKPKSSCLEAPKPSSDLDVRPDVCNKRGCVNDSIQVQRRRPVLKDLTSSNISKQYSDLAEIKLQLAQTQLKALQGDIEKRKEREEIEFKLKIKILELDLKIKEAQFNKITYL